MNLKIPLGLQPEKDLFQDAWSKDVFNSFSVDEVLHQSKSQYQELLVLKTPAFGNVLVLDGNLQCAEKDEAAYHELIVHPALCRENAAQENLKVLIIGGGDGGAAREALRHKDVSSVELVDIDVEVMNAARTFLPNVWQTPDLKGPLDEDKRLNILAEDGVAFLEKVVQENRNDDDKYDLIVVDASDPIGPGTVLYSPRFYAAINACLSEKGAVSVQSGSWFYFPEVLQTVFHGLKAEFPQVNAYECFSAIYPGGIWNLCLATRKGDPTKVNVARAQALQEVGKGCDWYDEQMHSAAFVLPKNVRRVLEKKPPNLQAVSAKIQELM